MPNSYYSYYSFATLIHGRLLSLFFPSHCKVLPSLSDIPIPQLSSIRCNNVLYLKGADEEGDAMAQ
jgi:hypothetical protein